MAASPGSRAGNVTASSEKDAGDKGNRRKPLQRGSSFATSAALRKNKAYLQLRREMEMRNRLKRKGELANREEIVKEKEKEATEKSSRTHTEAMDEVIRMQRVEEMMYVDKHRAAAVVFGTKDIKNVLKGKKRRERIETAQNSQLMESVEYETHLQMGEHELKNGDPKRALAYLSNACENIPEESRADPFLLKSICLAKLGQYEEADKEADFVLYRRADGTIKGLLNKAEVQYSLGRFEHSLKYFFRANNHRPENIHIIQGIRKCTEAISNALSATKGFDFSCWQNVIVELQKEQIRIDEEKRLKTMKKLGHIDGKESSNPEKKSELGSLEAKTDKISIDNEREEKEGDIILQPTPNGILIMPDPNMSKPISTKSCKRNYSIKEAQKLAEEKKNRIKMQKMNAEKKLLGEFYTDRIYFQNLLKNPIIFGADKREKKNNPLQRSRAKILEAKLSNNNAKGSNMSESKTLQITVKNCASEALDYLKARQDFWQQQEPVYARKNTNKAYVTISRLTNFEVPFN